MTVLGSSKDNLAKHGRRNLLQGRYGIPGVGEREGEECDEESEKTESPHGGPGRLAIRIG